MRAENAAPRHLAYLDGWRAVAALWVVLNHCYFTVKAGLVGMSGFLLGIFGYGRMAVDLFIVLSGFCLMLPVITSGGILRGGILEFLKRRALRIIPPYYCAVAFALLLTVLLIDKKTGTVWDVALPISTPSIVTHLLLIHDASFNLYNEKINYVFWSIAVEWRIYFFFPLLVWSWRKLGPVKTTLLGLVASWILHRACLRLLLSTLTMNYLGLFVLGMFAAAIVFSHTPSLLRWQKLPWGWITLAMTALVVTLYNVDVRNQIRDYGVGFWSASALVLTSLHRESWHHRILSWQPLAFVGTFAYSIYLIHSPLLQVLWQYPYAPIQSHPLWMIAALMASTPAIVATAYLFFLLFERPFLRKRKTATTTAIPALAEEMKLEQTGSSSV